MRLEEHAYLEWPRHGRVRVMCARSRFARSKSEVSNSAYRGKSNVRAREGDSEIQVGRLFPSM